MHLIKQRIRKLPKQLLKRDMGNGRLRITEPHGKIRNQGDDFLHK